MEKMAEGNNGGLVLYHFTTSYYSQRVVMAMHEKKLSFTSKLVSPLSMEQNQAWFLKLNPKGQVPVLQDGVKIVPDSNAIIDYLDDNFSNGNKPRLFPRDLDSNVKKKVQHFRDLIESVAVFPLTFGSIFNSEHVVSPKYPLNVPLFRGMMKKGVEGMPQKLRAIMSEVGFPAEFKPILERKANNMEEQLPKLRDKEFYDSVLEGVAKVLDEVEAELVGHTKEKSNWWLCCDKFTVADVYLSILLNRVSSIGMEHLFWSNEKRSSIGKYFTRVQQRESFVQATTVPKLPFLTGKSCPVSVGVVAAISILAIGAYLLYKRVK